MSKQMTTEQRDASFRLRLSNLETGRASILQAMIDGLGKRDAAWYEQMNVALKEVDGQVQALAAEYAREA